MDVKLNLDVDEAGTKAMLDWRTDHSGSSIFSADFFQLLINFFPKAKSIVPDPNSFEVSSKVEAEYSDDDESGEVVDGDTDEGEYSDEDVYTKLCSRDYESRELIQLCESALAHYQAQHPGESYKFESGYGGNYYFNIASEYNLEFCAKKADDNSIQNFKSTAFYHAHDEPEEFEVIVCFRLKDGVAELPMDYSVKTTMEYGQKMPNIWHEDIEEKEYEKIVKFSKSALSIYNENSGEFYELVDIQQARRWVCRGYEYLLVFTAKNKDDRISSTFKAYCNHLVPAIEVQSCWLC